MDEQNLTLEEVVKNLPKAVQRAILAIDLENIIQRIASKHSLHVDQTGTLGRETSLLLAGLVDGEEYVKNIATEMEIGASLAGEIAKDVNESILTPIKKSLMEDSEEENISREDILREIESPAPVRFATPTPAKQPSLIERHNQKVLGSVRKEEPRVAENSLPSPIDLSHELPSRTAENEVPLAPIPTKVAEVKTAPPPVNLPINPTPVPPTPSQPITQSTRTVSEIKIPKKPIGIDPYREPLE